MISQLKNKGVNKTLAPQKSKLPYELVTKSMRSQKFPARGRPNVHSLSPHKEGQRKIKKVKITKGGGPIYITSGRSSTLSQTGRKRSHLSKKRPTDLFVQAYRKDHTPLLKILQNKFMRDGRKGPAEKLYFKTLRELNRYSTTGSGFALFYLALERLKPALVTVGRRVGRNNYQVPVPVQSPRQYKMAFQWLLEASRKGPRLPLHRCLAEEVIATLSTSPGEAVKKKEALYRAVVTNRAYSHYRWI